MKKSIAAVILFLICAIMMAIAVYAIDNESSNTNKVEVEVEGVNYSIVYEKNNSLMRNAESEVSLLFDISTDNDKPFIVASYPTVAADETFNMPLDTYECSIENGKVAVKAAVGQTQDVIYVRTPLVATKMEAAIEVTDVDAFQVETHFDEQLETYITVISFDVTDLEVTPNRAVLNYNGGNTKSLFTNLYYDEVGNCTGGELWFLNPENHTLSGNFTLTIPEIHTIISSETVAVNLN